MSHACPWPRCKAVVPDSMWGCRTHWFTLPAEIRSAIWSSYQVGQGVADWTPAYREAFEAAQAYARKLAEGPQAKLL